jgi:hypothetical protein
MSERTFQGRQATSSVLVFCKAPSASSSGRAELLSTQGAITVDSRYIELGRSGLKANLDLKQENCVPASPLFRQLAVRGTRARRPPWTPGYSVGTSIAAGARHGHPGGPFAVLGT